MHHCRYGNGVKLSSLLSRGFEQVTADVALHPVMVALVLVFGLEFLGKLLNLRTRRIDCQADMPLDPVSRVLSEIDHFLAEQGRFADERLVVALLFGLDEEARTFLF